MEGRKLAPVCVTADATPLPLPVQMEVATDEAKTPIKQDTKKGKLRDYPCVVCCWEEGSAAASVSPLTCALWWSQVQHQLELRHAAADVGGAVCCLVE